MAEKISQDLDGISRTLLMTLYARARESQRPNAMLTDQKAVDMVNQLDCDFSKLRMQRHDEIAVIMRLKKFDAHARDFLANHSQPVVVHIGCGLDTRFERVDDDKVTWFDLDMPEVVELRRHLINTKSERYHLLPMSILEEQWINEVAGLKPRPFLFMAEGVLPYFEEAQVKWLVLTLLKNFPGCELVCDAHTSFVKWVDNLQLKHAKVKARLQWSIREGRDLESWGENIRLLDEWNYYQDDDSPLGAFRWFRLIPPLAKSSGIYRYRLGTVN